MEVKKVNTNIQIDIGAPTPTLLSNEHEVYLTFYVQIIDPNWDGTTVNIRESSDEGIATIKFTKYAQFKFGNPNDEAITGHPLYKYGLQAYSIQEVINSNWIEELKRMNSVHPHHKDSSFELYKHFIFFFHDRCFEIVCEKFEEIQDRKSTLKEEIERLSKILY